MIVEKLYLEQSLNQFIENCYHIESTDFNYYVPQTIGYPEATPEFIIILKGHLEVKYNQSTFTINKSCLFTFIDKPIIVKPSSKIKFIRITFKTLGVFPLAKLTGLSCHALTSTPVILCKHIFESAITQLEHSLMMSSHKSDLQNHLSSFLNNEFNKHLIDERDYLIIKALQSDICNVNDLCNAINMEKRTLQRWFNSNIGFSPKYYFRLKRFKHFLKDLSDKDKNDFLSIALSNNFYDQNHMIKEIKTFSNQTPSKISLEEYFPVQLNII